MRSNCPTPVMVIFCISLLNEKEKINLLQTISNNLLLCFFCFSIKNELSNQHRWYPIGTRPSSTWPQVRCPDQEVKLEEGFLGTCGSSWGGRRLYLAAATGSTCCSGARTRSDNLDESDALEKRLWSWANAFVQSNALRNWANVFPPNEMKLHCYWIFYVHLVRHLPL